jgi:hypothetical protein
MVAKTRKGYAELLNELQKADTEFKKAFKEIGSWRSRDKAATAKAQKKLDEFHKQLHIFFGEYLQPLSNRLLAGDLKAVDDLMEFLVVDVPVFRTGYIKEWYYRKLKKLSLSEAQIQKLREIAINRCISTEHRREDSELRRLMIKLADAEFLKRVAELPDSLNPHVRRRRMLMIEVVVRGRVDLQKALGVVPKPRY